MNTLRPTCLLLTLLALLAAGSARAQIYGGVGADGAIVLSSFKSAATNEIVVSAPKSAPPPAPAASRRGARVPTDQLLRIVDDVAARVRIDARLLHAVIQVESNYDPGAVSVKGASGLMQLMPATAERFGVKNLLDPLDNIEGGARYLKWLLSQFNNDLELALAAYNAGEQSVIRAGYRIPNYPETRNYVPKVLGRYAGADQLNPGKR